jgi:Flp pilus assembly protein TadD
MGDRAPPRPRRFWCLVLQQGPDPGISGTPTNSQSTAAAEAPAALPLDQAKVAALTKKVTSNPKGVASLQGLGDTYFAASDYKNAAVWEQKQWLVAAGLYPNNAEVHYDRGYVYLSQKPPDMAKMTSEWNKVVAIDPNSAMAKSVATHLKSAKTPVPSASAAPGTK